MAKAQLSVGLCHLCSWHGHTSAGDVGSSWHRSVPGDTVWDRVSSKELPEVGQASIATLVQRSRLCHRPQISPQPTHLLLGGSITVDAACWAADVQAMWARWVTGAGKNTAAVGWTAGTPHWQQSSTHPRSAAVQHPRHTPARHGFTRVLETSQALSFYFLKNKKTKIPRQIKTKQNKKSIP